MRGLLTTHPTTSLPTCNSVMSRFSDISQGEYSAPTGGAASCIVCGRSFSEGPVLFPICEDHGLFHLPGVPGLKYPDEPEEEDCYDELDDQQVRLHNAEKALVEATKRLRWPKSLRKPPEKYHRKRFPKPRPVKGGRRDPLYTPITPAQQEWLNQFKADAQ